MRGLVPVFVQPNRNGNRMTPNSTSTKAKRKQFYRTADIVDGLLPVSRTTLWNYIRTGFFPPPIRLNNRNVWPCEQVDRWTQEFIANAAKGAGK